MRHLVSRVCVYMKDIGIWQEQRMQVYISKLYLFRRGRGEEWSFRRRQLWLSSVPKVYIFSGALGEGEGWWWWWLRWLWSGGKWLVMSSIGIRWPLEPRHL